MGKATLYDLDRMCKSYSGCTNCPFEPENTPLADCRIFIFKNIDKANEIILNWCKEHPVETRQERFLKMFPNAKKDEEVINIDPCIVDETFYQASPCWECAKKRNVEDCEECRKKY